MIKLSQIYNIINESKNKPEVFLGGTCNGSTWRDELIPKLKINFFDPVVENWTEEDAKIEVEKRKTCDYCLYVITPKLKGLLSIGEVVEDSIKQPKKTLFCYLIEDEKSKFDEDQIKSLKALSKMIKNNGATIFTCIDDIANYLNKL